MKAESELTRLAAHVREESDRAPRRDATRENLTRQVRKVGSVIVTRYFLQEAFPRPDQTENFFLAASGCRPIASLTDQVEQWCASNDFELRYRPDNSDEVLIMLRPTKGKE